MRQQAEWWPQRFQWTHSSITSFLFASRLLFASSQLTPQNLSETSPKTWTGKLFVQSSSSFNSYRFECRAYFKSSELSGGVHYLCVLTCSRHVLSLLSLVHPALLSDLPWTSSRLGANVSQTQPRDAHCACVAVPCETKYSTRGESGASVFHQFLLLQVSKKLHIT